MDGNKAVILLSDTNLDKALSGIVQRAFGTTGQRFTATRLQQASATKGTPWSPPFSLVCV